ncbi:YhcN/YlaJ family sporulation lipoprotein [Bacillus sp. AK128]
MKKCFVISLVLLYLAGCTGTNQEGTAQGDNGIRNVSTNETYSEKLRLTRDAVAIKAKHEILNYEEINEVIAVHHDQELLVGFNVNKLDEFKVMDVEAKVSKRLAKLFPDEKITVSHDQKILIELRKLLDEDKNLSEKDIEKQLNKIKNLSKEKT